MSLEKASIRAVDPAGAEVKFQYNPTKYSVNTSLQWKQGEQKGQDTPPLEFVQGKGRTISMELMLDDYEKPTDGAKLVDRVQQLIKFTQVDKSTAKDSGKGRPPVVMFSWANKHAQFKAVINSLNVNYTMFLADGTPARATVSLQLQEWIDKPEGQNPTSLGNADLRAHRVIAGETLDLIAYQELGSASHWPYIAELNNLDDPFAIVPGQYLVVAPLR